MSPPTDLLMDNELVWLLLIYDKSGRELHHRISLSFFVVEIMTIHVQESIAKLNLQMVISPEQRKIIKFCGIILWHNSVPLLSWINISKPIHYPSANVRGDTF